MWKAASIVCAGLLLLACEARTAAAGLVQARADEPHAAKFKAVLKSVDAEQRTIRVTRAGMPDAREIEYPVAADARIIRGNGQKPLPDGLKDKLLVPEANVTLTIGAKDGVKTVTKIAVYGRTKTP